MTASHTVILPLRPLQRQDQSTIQPSPSRHNEDDDYQIINQDSESEHSVLGASPVSGPEDMPKSQRDLLAAKEDDHESHTSEDNALNPPGDYEEELIFHFEDDDDSSGNGNGNDHDKEHKEKEFEHVSRPFPAWRQRPHCHARNYGTEVLGYDRSTPPENYRVAWYLESSQSSEESLHPRHGSLASKRFFGSDDD
ncbi:hypothetical protein KEM56_001376 [Ascosphaera pollenicola]|nr:hypothetical protein KEM56_001376 [Ascosphaera pollenicola]